MNADQQVRDIEANHGIRIHHWPDLLRAQDYDETAALVASCDVVISVCQSAIHLAGSARKALLGAGPVAAGLGGTESRAIACPGMAQPSACFAKVVTTGPLLSNGWRGTLLITSAYREQNQKLHEQRSDYGTSVRKSVPMVADIVRDLGT